MLQDILPVSLLAGLAIALSLTMAGAWCVQRLTRNSGWIDVIWSAATGIAGAAGALWPFTSAAADPGRRWAVAVLALLWSARLAIHIARRAAHGEDDPRYADMAAKAGAAWPGQLFIFLQIQAAAAFVLVVSIRLAAMQPGVFPAPADLIGIGLLVIAVAGEAAADAQLSRFARAHKGVKAVCDTGLWSWSRHPNYFFEWLGWCAFAVIAHPSAGFAWGWAALAAPLMMYVLLVYASGIPPLEAHMLRSRGDAFRAYQARTSPFFPLPPRSGF